MSVDWTSVWTQKIEMERYPLVNCYIAMENCHLVRGFTQL